MSDFATRRYDSGIRRWWMIEDDTELASAVMGAARAVDDTTRGRQEIILQAYGLYGFESQLLSMGWSILPAWERVSHNVLANATDALVAEVTQSIPQAQFVPINASYDEQRASRKLSEYMAAKFDEQRFAELFPQVVRDAIIAGIGVLRPYIDGETVCYERVHPLNVLVDDFGAIGTTSPRSLYIRHYPDREQLIALYPEQADIIEGAPGPNVDMMPCGMYPRSHDVVLVIEAWHLPSSTDATDDDTDGRYVLAIDGAVLEDRPFSRPRFPLGVMRALAPVTGWWGESIVMRAAPHQISINRSLGRHEDSEEQFAVPRIFLEGGTAELGHISDEISIVQLHGGVPHFSTPAAMAPDFYSHLDRRVQWVYEEFGLDRYAATSMTPAGLRSGEAIRQHNYRQSRRFQNVERAAEMFVCDVARETTALERVIAQEHPRHEVVYEQHGAPERIPWRTLDIEEARLRIRCMAAGALKGTPGERVETAMGWADRGMIQQRQVFRIAGAGIPDVDGMAAEGMAAEDLLRQRFGLMLDGEDYQQPQPYMDLVRGIELCNQLLQLEQARGCPEERLDLLRQWIPDADEMMARIAADKAKRAAAMAPPPMPAGPPMMPEAPGMGMDQMIGGAPMPPPLEMMQ